MKSVSDLNFENVEISADLKKNLQNIKKIMNGSSDLLVNEIIISGHPSALICCEGMVSTGVMSELIFHPLMYMVLPENSRPQDVFTQIETKLLLSAERKFLTEYGILMQMMMSGFAIILTDGVAGAIALGAQGFERRGINEPSMETNLKGSHEGFVETIRVNISLIRRKIKSPTLNFEMFQLGTRSKTDVCLVYLTDRIPKKILKEIKEKLGKIQLETILSGGYVEPFLEGKHSTLFHNIGSTERPDVLCGKLLEGRVGFLIDGTPFALIIPYLFVENFQTMDDYNSKPYYATFIRWIKYLAFGITILLPGTYVAVATFHPELFHDVLLLNLAGAEQSAPLPLMAETLIMLALYEVLREAGIRLPKAVGGAVSLVGGLIIGDAAVSTGLISTPLLLTVAMAVTASFVIPALYQPTTILRFAFVLAGGTGGLFGVALLLAGMFFSINAMEDFGIPAAAPVSPFTLKSMRDVAIRLGFPRMQSGNVTIEKLNGVDRGGVPMKISWGQFAVLILLGRIFTLMTYAPLMSDGYSALTQMTAVIISTVLQAIMVVPLICLTKKYPNEDFFEIVRRKSNPICIIVSILYLTFALFICIKSVSQFTRFAATVFFPEANPMVLAAFFIILCAYAAWLGIESIARTASAVFVFFVIMLAAMGISSAGEMELFRFYPEEILVGEQLLTAVIDDFGRNGEILLAVFLLPNIQGGLRKGFFSGRTGKLIILEVITMMIITVLGGYARLVEFPMFSLGSYSGAVAAWRFDAVYLVVWTMTAAVHTSIFIAVGVKILKEQYAVSKTAALVIGSAVLLGCLAVFSGGTAVLRVAESATGAIPLAVLFFVIPTILLIGGSSHEKVDKNHSRRAGGADTFANPQRLPKN